MASAFVSNEEADLPAFGRMIDRFSSLPDKVAYHILSFLTLQDFARLRPVSRRCNSLCISAPNLTIDNRNYIRDNDLASLHSFNKFVDRYLDLRLKSHEKLVHFNLVWCYANIKAKHPRKFAYDDDDDVCVVWKFMSKVKDLDTQFIFINVINTGTVEIRFPVFLFLNPSLIDLKVSANKNYTLLPNMKELLVHKPKQEKLTLQSVQIWDSFFTFVITYYLRSLQSLYLYNCTGMKAITIFSLSLKHMEIINEDLVDVYSIKINAPKLEVLVITLYSYVFSYGECFIFASKLRDFVWYGFPMETFKSSKFSRLQHAAIYLTLPPEFVMPRHAFLRCMRLVVDRMRMAKLLRLHIKSIEAFYQEGRLPSRLDEIGSIVIDYCNLNDDQVPAIAFFLERMSKLRVLCITSSSLPTSEKKRVAFGMEYWESQDLIFVNQLKEARVQIHSEKGNDLELAKYLLKHAKDLETMVIICLPSMESKILAELEAYKGESTVLQFRSK